MTMKPRSAELTALMLAGAGLVLATADPAAAQAGTGGATLADLPILATQNGRTVASTRADAGGGFRFDLAPGTYDICIGQASTPRAGIGGSYELGGATLPGGASTRQTLPDRGPRLPGNGGRAGGQALGGAGAGAGGCFPYTASLPGTQGTTRADPIPVPIRLSDGSIVYALLGGMRTNDAPGGPSGPVRPLPDLPARASISGGSIVAAGDVNSDGRAQAGTGTNPDGRRGRVDPRSPPPAVATRSTVTLVGTLRLEPST